MTDSILYEAQPIPPADPDDRRGRWAAIIGAISVVAVLLIAVALGASIFRGEPTTDPIADPDPNQSVLTTTTPGSPLAARDQRGPRLFGGGEDGAVSRPGGAGPDLGPPTPALPSQEFTWERVTLDLPDGYEAYLQGVYAVDDGFLAIAMSWSDAGQNMIAWRSADGLAWEPTQLNGDFSNASISNVVFTDYGAIAFGETWVDFAADVREPVYPGYQPERIVWTSADGVNWLRTDLDIATAANEEVWISSGTAGPDGFIILGQRYTSPEYQPVTIEKDGYVLELNEFEGRYRVLLGTEVVTEGPMDEFYGNMYDENGQVIANPETGEVLTVVPWETWEKAWEQAYSQPPGGPFGGFGYVAVVVTIEHDGYTITVDEENGTYLIEGPGGDILASGSSSYLWRGAAPVITDASGTEILRFTWEEFDAAQQAFWEGQGYDDYDYSSRPIILASSDGVTWTEGTVDSMARETSIDWVVARDGGYVAYGNQYDELGGGSAIWSSPDGRVWTRAADMPGGMYIWNVKEAPDGTLLAIGDGPQGAALWSSTDGISWGEAFGARIPEDQTLYEWLNQFGTGELGTVIVGSREHSYYDEGYYEANPLTLTQEEYTLTFDDSDWPPTVTVVDTTTDDVVIEVQLREDGVLPEGFSYEDGVTYIENNDIVLLAITDEDWYAAQEDRWATLDETYVYEPAVTTMYFSTDLSEWTEVPFAFQGWISQVAVGSDRVVLAGEEYTDEPRLLDSEGAATYSGDEDYLYAPPPPVIFVGRP